METIRKRALVDFLIKSAVIWKALPYVFRYVGKTPGLLISGLITIFAANILNGRKIQRKLNEKRDIQQTYIRHIYIFTNSYAILGANVARIIALSSTSMLIATGILWLTWTLADIGKENKKNKVFVMFCEIAARASILMLLFPNIPGLNMVPVGVLRSSAQIAAYFAGATLVRYGERAISLFLNTVVFDGNEDRNGIIKSFTTGLSTFYKNWKGIFFEGSQNKQVYDTVTVVSNIVESIFSGSPVECKRTWRDCLNPVSSFVVVEEGSKFSSPIARVVRVSTSLLGGKWL